MGICNSWHFNSLTRCQLSLKVQSVSHPVDLVIPILVRKEARNGIVDKTTDVITADKTIVDKTIVDKIIVDKIIEGITDDKIDGGKATVNLAAIVQIIETAVDEAIAKSICISAGVMIDNCFFFFQS